MSIFPTRLALSLVILFSCDSNAAPTASTEMVRQQAIAQYAELAATLTKSAATAADEFLTCVEKLQSSPTEANIQSARNAWLEARKRYVATEPLRFSGGPIDDDDGPEQEINAWPIDTSAVDRLLANTSESPHFTPEILRQRHQVGGEHQATCGFQVLAYLLWKSPLPPDARHAEYLLACAKILRDDLKNVATEWNPDQIGNFRAMFAEEETLAIQRMITGPTLLGGGEIATRRLQLPLDAQDRTETTAPFVEHATEEIKISVNSLTRFWQCLEPFAKTTDESLAAVISKQTERMETLSLKLPVKYYEGGKDSESATRELVKALEDQAASLRKLGKELDLNIPLEVGPEGE